MASRNRTGAWRSSSSKHSFSMSTKWLERWIPLNCLYTSHLSATCQHSGVWWDASACRTRSNSNDYDNSIGIAYFQELKKKWKKKSKQRNRRAGTTTPINNKSISSPSRWFYTIMHTIHVYATCAHFGHLRSFHDRHREIFLLRWMIPNWKGHKENYKCILRLIIRDQQHFISYVPRFSHVYRARVCVCVTICIQPQ